MKHVESEKLWALLPSEMHKEGVSVLDAIAARFKFFESEVVKLQQAFVMSCEEIDANIEYQANASARAAMKREQERLAEAVRTVTVEKEVLAQRVSELFQENARLAGEQRESRQDGRLNELFQENVRLAALATEPAVIEKYKTTISKLRAFVQGCTQSSGKPINGSQLAEIAKDVLKNIEE